MNKRILLASIGVTLAIAIIVTASFGPVSPSALTTVDRKPFGIGVVTGLNDPLLIIAHEKGYFRDEGLDVAMKLYSTGAEAMTGMLNGEVDLASCSETTIVARSFVRSDFRILATTGSWDDYFQIVARKSRGIASPGDLRGKQIGIQKGASNHFFLHAMLAKRGIASRDAQVHFMPQSEMPAALAAGRIDAASTREPFIAQAQAKLGDDAVVFAESGIYTMTVNLAAVQKFTDARPGTVRSVLRALLKAETFAAQHPDESFALLERASGLGKDTLAKLLHNSRATVRIDQSLLLTLEEEARWMIAAKLTDMPDVPNYLNLIYLDALKSLKPSAITLIH